MLFIPVIALSFFLCQKLILGVFILASITDFLDGYFARAYKQTTTLGQILDPIADKALIATTILLMVGFQKISQLAMIPSCIILCREILVSEIRNVTLLDNKQFETSISAKWKTAIQMVSIICILSANTFPNCLFVATIGEILLWIAAIVAVHSGIFYFQNYLHSIEQK
jgi:CDP-diacylglycerol--glycerol-3-phosphate 3-phosphatidyltransferase